MFIFLYKKIFALNRSQQILRSHYYLLLLYYWAIKSNYTKIQKKNAEKIKKILTSEPDLNLDSVQMKLKINVCVCV